MEKTMAKKLFLIRHAEIDPAYQGRYMGRTDAGLSAEGILQARRLGERFGSRLSKCAFFASPALRCRQTWEAMRVRGMRPEILWEDLREVDFGEWEGRSFSEIRRDDPERAGRWNRLDSGFSFPGGESLQGFLERVRRVRDKVLRLPQQEAALVTHGGVIAFLLALFLGLPLSDYVLLRPPRASVSCVNVRNDGTAWLE